MYFFQVLIFFRLEFCSNLKLFNFKFVFKIKISSNMNFVHVWNLFEFDILFKFEFCLNLIFFKYEQNSQKHSKESQKKKNRTNQL
jgi:hypothetical protein